MTLLYVGGPYRVCAWNKSKKVTLLYVGGLPYVEHSVEEQSLAHQVCLKNEVFVRLTADWKEVVASWEEKHSSWSGWRIRSED